MTKELIENKITRLREAQINIQYSIAELVDVNSQLDGEIAELEKMADQM